MALISQNWTRSLLKESGSLTGVERGSFCVTEKNKRQILRENRGKRWGWGCRTSREAKQLVRGATLAPKLEAEIES